MGDSSIRVDVVLLDKLMNLVGELVLARNQVLQFSNLAEDPAIVAPSQRLNVADIEKLYLAGLLCDIGILVNSLLYPEEFQRVLVQAEASETPLCEVEQEVLGFTHCESGRILADIWKLPADISETIEFHHHPTGDHADVEMTCVLYLADLRCRLRGLGYGYYEAREFDLAGEVPWKVLKKKHPATAAGFDMARFTIELDQYGVEVQTLVDSIFSNGSGPH